MPKPTPSPSPARPSAAPAAHAVLALIAALASLAAHAGDWPQRRGPRADGISPETAWSSTWPADGPSRLWQTHVGTGFSGIVIAGGRAFTMGNAGDQDSVVALDSLTGTEAWRFTYAEPLNPKMYEGGPNATPTVAGEAVFTASRSGKIHALESATGRLRWTVDLQAAAGRSKNDWGVSGAPLVIGDRVLVNYGNGATALDSATGKVLWTMGGGDRNSFCSPVLWNPAGTGSLVLMHMKKHLVGVSLADGKERFRHAFGKGFETHCTDPVATPAGVFLSSGDDGGELLDLSGPEPRRRWKNPNLGTFTGTAVHLDGHLYGLDAGGYKRANQELRCLAVEDGSIRWTLPGFGQGSLIAAGDRLLVLSDQGELSVVKAQPSKAEVLARAQVLGGKCWTQPALADGLLYLRNARGDVVCLDLRG